MPNYKQSRKTMDENLIDCVPGFPSPRYVLQNDEEKQVQRSIFQSAGLGHLAANFLIHSALSWFPAVMPVLPPLPGNCALFCSAFQLHD
jgi:hypothetical protein